jgi:hypothetical protein
VPIHGMLEPLHRMEQHHTELRMAQTGGTEVSKRAFAYVMLHFSKLFKSLGWLSFRWHKGCPWVSLNTAD